MRAVQLVRCVHRSILIRHSIERKRDEEKKTNKQTFVTDKESGDAVHSDRHSSGSGSGNRQQTQSLGELLCCTRTHRIHNIFSSSNYTICHSLGVPCVRECPCVCVWERVACILVRHIVEDIGYQCIGCMFLIWSFLVDSAIRRECTQLIRTHTHT